MNMRLAKRFVLLLVASAGLPVLLAWSVALLSPPGSWTSKTPNFNAHPEYPLEPPSGWDVPHGGNHFSGWAIDWYERGHQMHRVSQSDFAVVAGWPFRCLYAYEYYNFDGGPKRPIGLISHVGITIGAPSRGGFRHLLPVGPLWPGLIADTAIAMAVLVTPIMRPELRRQFRQRRGQCVACGHKKASSQTRCPECGSDTSSIKDPSN